MTVDENGDLYAGGMFSAADGLPTSKIARWNGMAWSALGSGANQYVSALAVGGDGNLYVGGDFTTAGDKGSAYFGIWRLPAPSAVPSGEGPRHERILGDAAPNPFNPLTTLRFDLPESGYTRLAIYDLRGRLIRTLVDDALSSGGHQVSWDGRDEHGLGVASGAYLARIDAGVVHESTRLTLIR